MEEQLVREPSRFSKLFNRVARETTATMEERMSGGFFARARFEGKMRAYLMNGYRATLKNLREFELPNHTDDPTENIKALVSSFKHLYPTIVFNNIALARMAPDGSFTVEVETKEDEKNRLLSELSRGEILCEALKEQFGHYAFNGYEVRERRFSEYECSELKELGALVAQITEHNKPSLDTYASDIKGAATPTHLVGIRELGKYHALRIVAALREELQQLGEQEVLEGSPFDHSYEDIVASTS